MQYAQEATGTVAPHSTAQPGAATRSSETGASTAGRSQGRTDTHWEDQHHVQQVYGANLEKETARL